MHIVFAMHQPETVAIPFDVKVLDTLFALF